MTIITTPIANNVIPVPTRASTPDSHKCPATTVKQLKISKQNAGKYITHLLLGSFLDVYVMRSAKQKKTTRMHAKMANQTSLGSKNMFMRYTTTETRNKAKQM